MYEHERVPIAVCEREPSSIIAFALSCKEYKTALEDLSKATNAAADEPQQAVRYEGFMFGWDYLDHQHIISIIIGVVCFVKCFSAWEPKKYPV
ncbi:hypothetical protein AMECASPLE_033257 [Ameca splendens]|uniref:Uncharacterized protein n=1 Tax=Ameca splendens TaxID=208324 RepID=A0ABV1A267_9TELE